MWQRLCHHLEEWDGSLEHDFLSWKEWKGRRGWGDLYSSLICFSEKYGKTTEVGVILVPTRTSPKVLPTQSWGGEMFHTVMGSLPPIWYFNGRDLTPSFETRLGVRSLLTVCQSRYRVSVWHQSLVSCFGNFVYQHLGYCPHTVTSFDVMTVRSHFSTTWGWGRGRRLWKFRGVVLEKDDGISPVHVGYPWSDRLSRIRIHGRCPDVGFDVVVYFYVGVLFVVDSFYNLSFISVGSLGVSRNRGTFVGFFFFRLVGMCVCVVCCISMGVPSFLVFLISG